MIAEEAYNRLSYQRSATYVAGLHNTTNVRHHVPHEGHYRDSNNDSDTEDAEQKRQYLLIGRHPVVLSI